MAIKSVTTDYTGRKRDISILQYPDATSVETQTVFPKFGKSTRFCTGVQKLVQKYAIILLTNIQSQPKYPNFGTDFLYTLQRGISPTDGILAQQIFYLANYDAILTLRAYQSSFPEGVIPADERIVNATLEGYTLYGGFVGFDVKINTEAGDSINFVVPLPK
jgi:hypothetical protein